MQFRLLSLSLTPKEISKICFCSYIVLVCYFPKISHNLILHAYRPYRLKCLTKYKVTLLTLSGVYDYIFILLLIIHQWLYQNREDSETKTSISFVYQKLWKRNISSNRKHWNNLNFIIQSKLISKIGREILYLL